MAIANTNTRIGTTSNLPTGANYDLLMITYPDGFPEGQLLFNIDPTPRKVTGVQKVGQLFLKLLMTSKGSDVIYPNRGTDFSSFALNANLTVSDQILHSNLIKAIKDAEAQTRSATSSSTDPASKLVSVVLAGIDTSSESIVLYMQMTTADGVTAQLAVPFPELGLT